jgi:DNA polymerase kappa
MDAFYAAVEIRDNPALAHIPIAVEDKGMVMTTNYKAREFGVRSGIPSFIGKRLCPQIKYIRPNFAKYKEASKLFKSVLYQYDPKFEEVGLDEANLDVTDWLEENGKHNEEGRLELAASIRQQIKEKSKLTASCGIACNKMLAKICSDINKPDGQTYLECKQEAVYDFMSKLPIRKVPGVGKVNEQILSGMGIKLCQDTLDHAVDIAVNFTPNAFDFLVRSALGIAKNKHEDLGIKKSINVSETLPLISEFKDFHDQINKLCKELEHRASLEKLQGRTITLEFKNDKFKNKQKSFTSGFYMNEYEQFRKVAQ